MAAMIGLHEALAGVAALKGSTVVVKAGGELLQRQDWVDALATDVVALWRMGVQVVLVHGGGPQLDAAADAVGLERRKVAGRRVTSPEVLELAIGAWAGTLSSQWVRALQRHGAPAAGIAGFSGELLTAARRPPAVVTDDEGVRQTVDYGEVGDVTGVNVGLLKAVLGHAIPVISPLAAGPAGTVLNVNADTVAAELAVALGAQALVLLTQAPGILSNPDDPATVLPRVDLAACAELLAAGALQGGMRPKVAAIRRALEGKVARAHVVDGRLPGVLLEELLTHEGRGTLVVS
jgi:acetylglutamate kinase